MEDKNRRNTKLSVYLSFLLRHRPDSLGLAMDQQGYVSVEELLAKINRQGRYKLSRERLDAIVSADSKRRYAYSPDGRKIRACQGHSIPWVQPVLEWKDPPAVLYHGTTVQAYCAIFGSGGISRMNRHGVHLHPQEAQAWEAARRWKKMPVVLKVDAAAMAEDGFRFGVSENGVWCVEKVPIGYLTGVLYGPSPECLQSETET